MNNFGVKQYLLQMKTGKALTTRLILKWLPILTLAAIVIVAIPSCKGKNKSSENSTEKVTNLTADNDSLVLRGQQVPADAPDPPSPPPPLPYNVKNGDTVWFRVDELPLFPGGENALSLFIEKTFTYPESAVKKKIQGRVVVGFVMTKECKITDIKIVTGIDPDCDKEAMRVVNSLPKFEKPAYVDGRPVSYHFTLPVQYVLK
jgi:TonB family protein